MQVQGARRGDASIPTESNIQHYDISKTGCVVFSQNTTNTITVFSQGGSVGKKKGDRNQQ